MRIRHIAAAGAAAAALTLGASLPAFADGSQEAAGTLQARGAKIEVYEGGGFQGKHTVFTHSMPNLGTHGWDFIGSARNTGTRTATFYRGTCYEGARFVLAPGRSAADLGSHGMESPGCLLFG
ncbi:hypothetical protein [Streptomyces chattanoogensis]|uniref:hypothetical protein n=1 Tax=Streptomyces chattanoogensis TaxID=66876 RepID=UPI00369B1D53